MTESSAKFPEERGVVRSQNFFSGSASVTLRFNFMDPTDITRPALHYEELIEREAKKIVNQQVRELFTLRALFSVKDARGRTLTDEELHLLDKYLSKKDLSDSELERLNILVPTAHRP